MKLFNILILLCSFIFFGCVPEEETQFNKILSDASMADEEKEKMEEPEKVPEIVQCKDAEYQKDCEDRLKCQPLLDKESDKYLACIPLEKKKEVVEEKEDEKEVAEKKDEEEVDEKLKCANDDDNDDEEESKKIIICHVPHGNAAAMHSICISKQGWLNGHQGRHFSKDDAEIKDHLGACSEEEMDDDKDDDDKEEEDPQD